AIVQSIVKFQFQFPGKPDIYLSPATVNTVSTTAVIAPQTGAALRISLDSATPASGLKSSGVPCSKSSSEPGYLN
ncbi:MAG: hypothetical protein J6Q80_01085, partial [Lentisphaeria bacterium]|nr:hypothetical protein [Lentisphaeria bacterium]